MSVLNYPLWCFVELIMLWMAITIKCLRQMGKRAISVQNQNICFAFGELYKFAMPLSRGFDFIVLQTSTKQLKIDVVSWTHLFPQSTGSGFLALKRSGRNFFNGHNHVWTMFVALFETSRKNLLKTSSIVAGQATRLE